MELMLIVGGRVAHASNVTEAQVETLVSSLKSHGLTVNVDDDASGGKVIRAEKTTD